MGDQLVDFLRERKKISEQVSVDWDEKKRVWIAAVEGLYSVVQEMLAESIASKDVSVRKVDTQITEDFAGSYAIPILELGVGNERVEFRPKGMNVIGAAGRVDIVGARDAVTLVLEQPELKGEWKVVLQRVPKPILEGFSPSTLKWALERVMLPLV
jgi:hypothetical protein